MASTRSAQASPRAADGAVEVDLVRVRRQRRRIAETHARQHQPDVLRVLLAEGGNAFHEQAALGRDQPAQAAADAHFDRFDLA
jgi:hypothetical protein